MGGAEGGGAEAAVAVDDGGKALTAPPRRSLAGTGRASAWRWISIKPGGGVDCLPHGVDYMSGGRCGQIADGGDPAAGNGHHGRAMGGGPVPSMTVPPPDKGIKHGPVLSLSASPPSEAGDTKGGHAAAAVTAEGTPPVGIPRWLWQWVGSRPKLSPSVRASSAGKKAGSKKCGEPLSEGVSGP